MGTTKMTIYEELNKHAALMGLGGWYNLPANYLTEYLDTKGYAVEDKLKFLFSAELNKAAVSKMDTTLMQELFTNGTENR